MIKNIDKNKKYVFIHLILLNSIMTFQATAEQVAFNNMIQTKDTADEQEQRKKINQVFSLKTNFVCIYDIAFYRFLPRKILSYND